MFSRHANRMLRSHWPTPQMLAEELFAIFSQADLPLHHQGPMTIIRTPENSYPWRWRGFEPDDPVMIFEHPEEPEVSIVLTRSQLENLSRLSQEEITITGNTFMGKVTGGTGANYTVELVATGEVVDVVQQQIAEDETIPVNTFCLVVLGEDDVYRMQVPVWL